MCKSIFNTGGYPIIKCCILAFMLHACNNKPAIPVSQSFYYWKTVFKLNNYERETIEINKINRLYIRYFDVIHTGSPQPESTIVFKDSIPRNMEVIPVVFIVNNVLIEIPHDSIAALAIKIGNRIGQINSIHGISHVPEIQIDCDWNSTTRDKYFQLLRVIHDHPLLQNRLLSVTLRLHQAKYRKRTGIPPVDRVTLMCYNMGRLTEYGNHNSILDISETKAYMEGTRFYPLPADIALPLFSWGVCFDGQQKYRGLINGLSHADMQQTYFRKTAPEIYRSDSTVVLRGAYIRKGDHIRLEEPSAKEIKQVADMLAEHMNTPGHVIWYHLDSLLLQKYPDNELQKIITAFR